MPPEQQFGDVIWSLHLGEWYVGLVWNKLV
jgi:hypothetical protein